MNKRQDVLKPLVLLSGGQDSITALGVIIDLAGKQHVQCVSFDYGQKHKVELECAKEICKKYNLPHHVFSTDILSQLGDSALTTNGDVNQKHPRFNNLPASFVPNRNMFLLTVAHGLAQKLGLNMIVAGFCQTDYSGYPDCRQEFMLSMESTLYLSSFTNVSIFTPLMYLTKAQTFDQAERVGFLEDVIELSHTCYNGDREHKHDWGYGCGECPACKLRKKGWEEYGNSRR